ncbi:MAG: hypothetical protein C4518_17625 [Desulfobacteraceae bacterium]|nr:MAG: hypothetical protein C4518_17625 [Desulfobacteraceae bacterium]
MGDNKKFEIQLAPVIYGNHQVQACITIGNKDNDPSTEKSFNNRLCLMVICKMTLNFIVIHYKINMLWILIDLILIFF